MYKTLHSSKLGLDLSLEGAFFMPNWIGKILCHFSKSHKFDHDFHDDCVRNCGFSYEMEDSA
jgi:hypothetical protein